MSRSPLRSESRFAAFIPSLTTPTTRFGLLMVLVLMGSLFTGLDVAEAAPSMTLTSYYLPYQSGARHQVTQTWGQADHVGVNLYAVDFDLNEGDPVINMKAGTVKAVKLDSNYGICAASAAESANYVIIAQDDGYDAIYLHLQQNSSLTDLTIGHRVEHGVALARAGHTGWSCGPHLHVQVQQPCSNPRHCQSVPFIFNEIGGQPVQWARYTSSNDPPHILVALSSYVGQGKWMCYPFPQNYFHYQITLVPVNADIDLYLMTQNWSATLASSYRGGLLTEFIDWRPNISYSAGLMACAYGYQAGNFGLLVSGI